METEESQVRRDVPDAAKNGDYKPLIDALVEGLDGHTVELYQFEWGPLDITPRAIFLLDGKEWMVGFEPTMIKSEKHFGSIKMLHGIDAVDEILESYVNSAKDFLRDNK